MTVAIDRCDADHYLESYARAARDVADWQERERKEMADGNEAARDFAVDVARRVIVNAARHPVLRGPSHDAYLDAFGGRTED